MNKRVYVSFVLPLRHFSNISKAIEIYRNLRPEWQSPSFSIEAPNHQCLRIRGTSADLDEVLQYVKQCAEQMKLSGNVSIPWVSVNESVAIGYNSNTQAFTSTPTVEQSGDGELVVDLATGEILLDEIRETSVQKEVYLADAPSM